MRIFIDVGGHIGQTLDAVIDPIYDFDIIYCFEPVKHCYEEILKIKNKKIIALNFGLLHENTSMYINYPGSEAASIYSDHNAYNDELYTENYKKKELCQFLSVSDFFLKNIGTHDYVVMKLNCEGSECSIIQSLIENNQFSKIDNLLIDFDVDKIPSMIHLKQKIIDLIATQRKNYHFPQDVQYGGGSHFGGIKKWLNQTNVRNLKLKLYLKSLAWDLLNLCHQKHLNYYKFQFLKLLPNPVVNIYYKKVKGVIK